MNRSSNGPMYKSKLCRMPSDILNNAPQWLWYNPVMLSDKDIDKLLKVFPTRAEVEHIVEKNLEEGLAPIKNITQQTLLPIEVLASRHDKQELVNASRDGQQSRHDRWIHQIVDEPNVHLKD